MPFCCWTIQLPRLFLPIKTMADVGLHDGGSTSFTSVFLLRTMVSAISSRLDMNSSAPSPRFHKGRIRLRRGPLEGLVQPADKRADGHVAYRLIPMIEFGIE